MSPKVTLAGRGPEIVTVCWIFTSVALAAVGARLFTRIRLRSAAGFDDLAISIAMFLEIVFSAMATASALTGTGQHQQDLLPDQIAKAINFNKATMVLAVWTFNIPKIAVVILLVRLLEPPKAVRALFYTILGSLLFLCALFAIVLYVQCSGNECWSPNVLLDIALVLGTCSAGADLLFAVYPIIVIRHLQITFRKKVGLCALMAMGFFACWASIYKCIQLPTLADRSNYLFATADLIMWTSIEANVIISAASLQCVGPFVQMCRDKSISLAYAVSSKLYSKRSSSPSDQLISTHPSTRTDSSRREDAQRHRLKPRDELQDGLAMVQVAANEERLMAMTPQSGFDFD